jgi:hypothetical protein
MKRREEKTFFGPVSVHLIWIALQPEKEPMPRSLFQSFSEIKGRFCIWELRLNKKPVWLAFLSLS